MTLTKLSKTAVAGLVVLCLCGLGIGGFQGLPAQETKTTITTTTTTAITKQAADVPKKDPACGQYGLISEFRIKLEFTGDKVVDFRVKGVNSAALPVKIRLLNIQNYEQRFSSREFAFQLLNERGETVEGHVARPHSIDPKLHPTRLTYTHWDVLLQGKEVVDDPQLCLFRHFVRTTLKSGRYTLVCAVRGEIATISFNVITE